MIHKKQTFYISPDVLSQTVDSETILLDMKRENYFGLNEMGSRVLKILNRGTTLNAIIIQLVKEYDVEQHQLENDAAELLQELLDEGLIQTEIQ